MLLFWQLYSLIPLLVGILNENQGIFQVARVYIIYPFLFLIFYKLTSEKIKIFTYTKILIYINFIVLLDIFLFVLYEFKISTFYFNFPMNTYGINIQNNMLKEVSVKSMIILAFFIPFNFKIISIIKEKKFLKVLNYINISLNLIVSIFFGRDILSIILLLTIISYIFSWRRLILTTVTTFFLFNYYQTEIIAYVKKIEEKLMSSERFYQVVYLWEGFKENILLGKGFGGSLGFFLRSEEQPWAYEMTYNYLLFSLGLIGTIIIGFYLLLPVILVLRYNKGNKINEIKRAFCYGYIGFMLATSSNPYFFKFDYINLYFLVLFVVLKKEGE